MIGNQFLQYIFGELHNVPTNDGQIDPSPQDTTHDVLINTVKAHLVFP